MKEENQLNENLIFSSHLWERTPEFHSLQRQNYLDTLDDYRNNTPSFGPSYGNHSDTTFVSNTDLHLNPAFSDIISQIVSDCEYFIDTWKLDSSVKIGISKMWASIAKPGGMTMKQNIPFTFLTGLYFLSTPPDSGDLMIENPTINPDFFSRLPVKEVLSFNAPGFAMPMPEGLMIYVPGNLKIDITNNANGKNQTRYLIHFALTML